MEVSPSGPFVSAVGQASVRDCAASFRQPSILPNVICPLATGLRGHSITGRRRACDGYVSLSRRTPIRMPHAPRGCNCDERKSSLQIHLIYESLSTIHHGRSACYYLYLLYLTTILTRGGV